MNFVQGTGRVVTLYLGAVVVGWKEETGKREYMEILWRNNIWGWMSSKERREGEQRMKRMGKSLWKRPLTIPGNIHTHIVYIYVYKHFINSFWHPPLCVLCARSSHVDANHEAVRSTITLVNICARYNNLLLNAKCPNRREAAETGDFSVNPFEANVPV